MSRLDRHVTMIQGKLTLERFLVSLGYSLVIFFSAVLLVVLVDRFLDVAPPRAMIWFWSALGVSAMAAFVVAMTRKPTAHQAAVFIDDKLGLKEKFSTALFVRKQADAGDPFAIAAVRDAERTADNVSLHKRFPLQFPRSGYWAILAAVIVLPLLLWLPHFDLFGLEEKLALSKRQAVERQTAQHEAQKVLAAVSSLPKAVQSQTKVELAKRDLTHALEQNTNDTAELKMTAQHAQEEAEQAKMEEMKSSQAFAQDLTDKAVFNSLNPAAGDHSTVADASRDIASGNFSKAADTLKSMSDKFNDMSDEDKKKAADQMAEMAKQLGNIAKDPAAMQKLQQQLQQHGATQQQAQQIAQAAQQAAQGNPQAQQQLQQMQQQLQQQMNGGKGPTAQQQSAIAKAMQQIQSVAGSQASAQQMAKAAQQMAQGMQQAQASQSAQSGGSQKGAMQQASAKQGGQQPGQQKSGGQQSKGGQQQGGTQQASAGQQGAQQQATGGQNSGAGKQPGGNQPGGQQANGGGQSGQGQGQQQMKQAGQQMADALDKMDATKKDAEQQVAEGNGANDANGQDGDSTGNGGTGDYKTGNPGGQKGNGMGGPGIGQGGIGKKQVAAFTVHQEKDPSQNIANGKILAKTFVKADQLIGKSTIQLSTAAKAAVKESTDDVEGENEVPKDAQKMVKDYFNTMDTTPQ